MNRGKLVVITGIDGAGKSTTANRVIDELQQRGYDAEYVYGRYLPKLLFPVMEFGRRTALNGTDIESDYDEHQRNKQALFSRTWVRCLYEASVMFDYTPQLFYRLALPLLRSDYVICDRFFYDTLLTDLSETVIQTPNEAIEKYHRYAPYLPTPEHEFYIKIPIETSLQRKSDIPSRGYIERKKRFYDEFATSRAMKELDGQTNQDELIQHIVTTILPKHDR